MKCNVKGTPHTIPMKFYVIKRDLGGGIGYYGCKICGRSDFERKEFIWHMRAIHEEILEVIK